MKSKLINSKKTTFLIKIGIGWKELLMGIRAETGITMRDSVEKALKNEYNYQPINEKGG